MKTKTTIPWAAILKEYNANCQTEIEVMNWYICHLSPIFRSLWDNDNTKREIKKLMHKFLCATKKNKDNFNVIFDNFHDCLLYGNASGDEASAIKKEFLEYMVAKSKSRTKYSYFCHVNPTSFGNPGAATFLARRDNKTGEFSYVYYDRKLINPISSTKSCEDMVALGTWVPANQTEINKIKRLYREPKYLYYRYFCPEYFGNPGSKYQYIVRYNVKTGIFHSMFYNKRECNNLGKSHLWHDAINKGEWLPARQKEIKLAIKLNK